MENEKLVELLEDKEQFGRKIAEGLAAIAVEIFGEEIKPNSVSGKKILEEIMTSDKLSEHEKSVIQMVLRTGTDEESLKELSSQLGQSKEVVMALRTNAIKKLDKTILD